MLRTISFCALALSALAPAQTSWQWSNTTPGPAPMIYPSAAFDPIRNVAVVGGSAISFDTWEWDGTTWTRVTGRPSPLQKFPLVFDGSGVLAVAEGRTWRWMRTAWLDLGVALSPPDAGVELAYDPRRGRVVAFGGNRIFTTSADTWEWNGLSWTRMSPAHRPPGRTRHAMTFDETTGRVLLFGGMTDPFRGILAADTWEWDGVDWVERHPSTSPGPRHSHTLTHVERLGVTLLHGGNDGSSDLADLWSWNGNEWRLEMPQGAVRPRSNHAAFLFPQAQSPRIVVYDGLVQGAATSELQTLTPTGQIASYRTYRQSCPSSVGVPELSATAPVVGRIWTLTVTNLRPHTAGYLFFAVRDDRLGLNLLPLDLTFIGANGCFLNVNSEPRSGATVQLLPSNAVGRAVANVGVPNVPAVLGYAFFNQYVSLDAPLSRPLRITTTNAGIGIVGL